MRKTVKSPPKGRILIVDDDERNLLALSEVLSPIADVATASSGKDALHLLLKNEFAVILLDVFMPGMDGYETVALIRERIQIFSIAEWQPNPASDYPDFVLLLQYQDGMARPTGRVPVHPLPGI